MRTRVHISITDWYVVAYPSNTLWSMWEGPLSWWRHQMETFSALLAICVGNSPVTGEFPTQRPVTRSFDVFFDPRLNQHLSKHSWGWWFETPSCPLWRQSNMIDSNHRHHIHYIQLQAYPTLVDLVYLLSTYRSRQPIVSQWCLIWYHKSWSTLVEVLDGHRQVWRLSSMQSCRIQAITRIV